MPARELGEALETALVNLAIALDRMDRQATPGSYVAPWASVNNVLDAARSVIQAMGDTLPTQPTKGPP